MATIPASAIVNVVPGVIAAGGTGLALIGLMLTNNTRIPIGTVQSFASAASVASFFGATTDLAAKAAIYFTGQQNALQVPAALLIAQYPSNPVAAYLQGGNISGLPLASLQALSGNLGLTINGVLSTASISLSAANSFSQAAQIIGNALLIQGVQVATFTGSAGGTAGPTNVLTVTSLTSGTIGIGDIVSSGTGFVTGTYITSQLSGSTGGTGTYQLNTTVTFIGTGAIIANAPGVTYDSISGAFIFVSSTTGSGSTITFGSGALATSLLLTQVTGAILSQGAGAATPVAFMNSLVAITQNWATFFTHFNPDTAFGGGNSQKLAFAQWASQQNNRWVYLPWDTDASPTVSNPATSSLGYLIGPNGSNYSGTSVWYDPNNEGVVAAVAGAIAQVNFNQINGRQDMAFLTFAGLTATVTNQQVMQNLIANGYNFYGAFGTAAQNFVYTYPGSVSGPFLWLDSFINQIWMNSQFQLTLMLLLGQITSIPYNTAGNNLIASALQTPINQALSFGAIRAGGVLSSSEITAITTVSGNSNVAATVSTQGWYLQILPATPAVRQARGSPPINFWYFDGGSIQAITLNSLEVQ